MNNGERGAADQPEFQLPVFRNIGCNMPNASRDSARNTKISFRLLVPPAKAQQCVDDEEMDANKKDAGNHQRDRQRVVHLAPVRGQRREPPRIDEMKQQRARDDHNQRDSHRHIDLLSVGKTLRNDTHQIA